MDWVWAALVALVAIILLHQPVNPIQKFATGDDGVPFAQMFVLKFLVGFVTCAIIIGACAVFLRPVSKGLIVGSVVTQLLWLEIEWGFTVAARDFGELAVRFAEETGTAAFGAGMLIYLMLRRLSRPAS